MAATADQASPNRKYFKMHKLVDGNAGTDVAYWTKNIYTQENWFFFPDTPHLIKTLRNWLFSSGLGLCTQRMWNSGFILLWSHISRLYYEDLECGLKLVSKPTSDDVNLTSYLVVTVKLAAQVLREAVGNVLNSFGPRETASTAKFCITVDKCFDCLNVRNTTTGLTMQDLNS